ncbi:bifunctional diaminohydroxyphosphoribosylaminopyrimidine deaminase/5-amino-6-(5-phosphoribosylamino)uracil reductase RibD [Paenarthrobacter sp. DKR-5]|uniref:bifunctional diaminohydroxyphosphoribosylaminopyrimidine deaminase/5-amino-6-(5-phosphoribosylamino)uracil reductase RibD n=1 Tax=Paenarthrobacter sp. DKR-5 TaxID=2835535 RepID=UPI001BDD100B|nr:bifunctional diaminohydroxyphosphoribosylaminopyrimidine deaminase/5-amino-6-(5-phosphoribosylamino)uracil reductase RibD [Paenarthrobacter sp. DKR-5]MBT1002053.1 bifunctional diaminohydroxyphosphoribosylaminopyrimidine deaminase/5-amino-6-(5-phosphoribosylamino)uracil reductase RibD [Paenarthrobacter sp. DKR-5]
MAAALTAAYTGVRGANPLVGSVILDAAGSVLASGHHRGAGTPHAEVDAIARALAAGAELAGTTIIVTLEPCNHVGRTGPCTQAIIDAGISRVVYAVDDPHDRASGGAATLRAAGIEVRSGLMAEEARKLNNRWFDAVSRRRPFVTLHLAQTLDSRIAAEDGTSQWISCPESLADNHALRGRIDAILVGSRTVEIDNPRLTARNLDGTDAAHQPLRAVMGLSDVPAGAAVRGDGNFMHLRTREPGEALATLFDAGVRHLMVEGGSKVAGAFLQQGLVDELIVYLAPTLLGSGTPALSELGVGTLSDAQRWEWDDAGGGAAIRLGRDLRLHLEPAALEPATLPASDSATGGH